MTPADTAPLTWAYVGEAVGFMAFLLLILLYALWATRDGRKGFVERWLENRFARREAKATENTHVPALRAIEMERSR